MAEPATPEQGQAIRFISYKANAPMAWPAAARHCGGPAVEVLGQFNGGDEEDINIIFSSQRHLPLRVRAMIDFLVEKLGGGVLA